MQFADELINFDELKGVWLIIIVAAVLLLNSSNIFKASAAPIRFTYGVASGDISSSSAVLWTRTDQDATIQLEVSRYPHFDKLDFTGYVHAAADNDFTAKLIATGLIPNTQYLYRWRVASTFSDVGYFKTAPSSTQAVDLHFSWSGDSDPSKVVDGNRYFGDWTVLKAAQNEKPPPDFFIYLGDVIYSDLRANKPPPQLPDVTSLTEFRQIYKDSRDVMALHNLLEGTSIYSLWDDHEVRGHWTGQSIDKTTYGIGKKSFNEYMPIQEPWAASDPVCAGPTQFRVKHWGMNIDIIIIDTRSCRSDSAKVRCHSDLAPMLPSYLRVKYGLLQPPPAGCVDALKNPNRTMLGLTQKAMFKDALLHSKAKFKFVISSVNMQQEYVMPYDRWEGYAAERSEILNFIRANAIKNVIFLSTDSHQNLMNEVFIDYFTDPTPVAYEFVTGPIAALTFEKTLLALDKSYLADYQQILTGLGADCRNLNVLSYGSVSFTQGTGLLAISLKDESGNIIHDEVHTGPNLVLCTKTFRP